jgi:hypothetical protein
MDLVAGGCATIFVVSGLMFGLLWALLVHKKDTDKDYGEDDE